MIVPKKPASAGRQVAALAAVQGGTPIRDRHLRFVRRMHGMRVLGLGLGFLCVGSVFRLHGAPWSLWLLLAANGFIWPHLARVLATRSGDPRRSEMRHLALDSAFGGAWIALMQFNLLPSVLLVTMLSVDKIAVGGLRFALRTTIVLVVACAVTSAALGFPVSLKTPMAVIAACVPFLIAYPLAISYAMYGLARKVAQQNRWLAELSYTDELTGLANRRQGFAAAGQALARHRRMSEPAVLIVLDIDQFKDVNDRYGHPAGDQILRGVAAMLQDCSRVTDTPARYAGDEFLLVLPNTDLEGAARMAARIRESLGTEHFEQAPGLRCTLSFGAAEAHADMADVEDWIQQADAALYRAKSMGRDRLVCAPRIGSGQRHDLDGSVPDRGVGDPAAEHLHQHSMSG